jgi:hypothetical protein
VCGAIFLIKDKKVGAALRAAMDGIRSGEVAAEDSGSHIQTMFKEGP